jgi:RNA polymerase sigma-70 factor, ECF subfamily
MVITDRAARGSGVRGYSVTDEVVTAARAGDSAALTAIYQSFAPAITGYLRAKGLVDPEGTTSEVFLAVLPKIATVTGGAQGLRTLIFTVAHARMVDEHRARARRPEAVSYDPARDERVTDSAEDDAHDGLSTEWVCEVLALLAPDQRDVLALRIVADLSVDQVAEIIERSPGAVKQLQRRGLLALRQAMADRGVTR